MTCSHPCAQAPKAGKAKGPRGRKALQSLPTNSPTASPKKVLLIGLARILRLGPALCLGIPISRLDLARNLGPPCANLDQEKAEKAEAAELPAAGEAKPKKKRGRKIFRCAATRVLPTRARHARGLPTHQRVNKRVNK